VSGRGKILLNGLARETVFAFMRYLGARLFCLVLLWGSTIQGQTEEWRTSVSPLSGEEILLPCEYRMVIPVAKSPVKAVWVIFDRGQDYLRWYEDRRVRGFAGTHHMALVLAAHCRSKERDDMIVLPGKGVGRALYTALDQLAESSGHAELKTSGIVAMGWSGAGSLAARLAAYLPERYIAGMAFAPGQYEPLGMDTIELSASAMRKPQLIIANGGDNVNGTERPYAYFRRYFERGAPWTFVVQNRAPHCCLQNAQTLMLEWLHAVLEAPTQKSKGEGYLKVAFSNVVDEWKRPVFDAIASRVGPPGQKRRGELTAGWMPSSAFAEEWLVFTKKASPVAVWTP